MRDKWYADNRDLVKWGVLLQLVDKYQAETVVQVAYYRPNDWGHLEIDGESFPISESVLDHFRTIQKISQLDARCRIDVFDLLFQDRGQYADALASHLARSESGRKIVFLDPDTGLEPQGRAGYEHVLGSELREIWHGMRAQDVLVLYQHQTNRRGEPWIAPKRRQFEEALGLCEGGAGLAHGPSIANDVAFYFCQKPGSTEATHGRSEERVR